MSLEAQIDLEKLSLNRLNEYYGKALDLASLIISSLYIESLFASDTSGFSFLINMNKVFESLITKLVVDTYTNYDVRSQKKLKNIVIETSYGLDKPKLKPDIEIWDKDIIVRILDAKYKEFSFGDKVQSADIYQAIIYSFAWKNDVILVFPSAYENNGGWHKLSNGKILYIKTIKLDKSLKGRQYIEDLQMQIKNIIGL